MRQVFFINPEHKADGGFIPCLVTEGEPGYRLMSGADETVAPWVWGPDYAAAVMAAERENKRRFGFDKPTALKIVAENMGLSRAAEQVTAAVIDGLEEYHESLRDGRTRATIERRLFTAYRETGNQQRDYERLRDECERMLSSL